MRIFLNSAKTAILGGIFCNFSTIALASGTFLPPPPPPKPKVIKCQGVEAEKDPSCEKEKPKGASK